VVRAENELVGFLSAQHSFPSIERLDLKTVSMWKIEQSRCRIPRSSACWQKVTPSATVCRQKRSKMICSFRQTLAFS